MNRPWVVGALLAAGWFALAGCGNDDSTMVTLTGAGAGGTRSQVGAAGSDSGGTGGAPEPPPCVENPVTHLEIINACTDAIGIRKRPQLTLLNPDGTLPPP